MGYFFDFYFYVMQYMIFFFFLSLDFLTGISSHVPFHVLFGLFKKSREFYFYLIKEDMEAGSRKQKSGNWNYSLPIN